MRKRKFLIGGVLGVVGAMALVSSASAAVTGQTLQTTAGTTKLDKKKLGPVGPFTNVVDTTYNAPPAVNFAPAANRTVLTFDKDFRFNPGTLPECSTLTNADDAAASKAKCPGSVVGQGSSVLRTQLDGTINATVTAFVGPKSGTSPVIILKVDPTGVPTKPSLVGTLTGSTLDVTVPVTPGAVIVHFDTTINQVVTQVKKKTTKNKKTGKKKTQKIKTFYVMAKCSDGKWDHSETTTYTDTSTKSAVYQQACTKKKVKKKKK